MEETGKKTVEVVKKVRGPWDEDEEDSEDDEAEIAPVPAEETEAEAEVAKAEEPIKEGEAAEEAAEEIVVVKPVPLFNPAPLLKDDESADPTLAFGAVTSLRMENCGLRGGALEVLGSSPSSFPFPSPRQGVRID